MSEKIRKFFPVGFPIKQEMFALLIGFFLSVLTSFRYFSEYNNAYNNLFVYTGNKKLLIEGSVMPDFYVLSDGCMDGFVIMIMFMFVLCIIHYYYHKQGSKSIYTMKRLPHPAELHIRCLTIPFLAITVCIISSVLLFVLFYKHYMSMTPPECIAPDQIGKLLSSFI